MGGGKSGRCELQREIRRIDCDLFSSLRRRLSLPDITNDGVGAWRNLLRIGFAGVCDPRVQCPQHIL